MDLEKSEKMHSLQGAFSESLYIYAPCIEKVIQSNHISHKIPNEHTKPVNYGNSFLKKPRILSIGFGLGYNELITHGFLLKAKKYQFVLISFEKEGWLINFFKSWLKGKNSPLNQCYNEILKRVSEYFNETPEKIKKFCYQSLKEDFFQILGNLPSKNPFNFNFTSILYDAFSSYSNPELWTENYLRTFLKSYCDPKECYFSTYAATGSLKKALKAEGFQITNKKGFAKKRESTFAFKKHQ